MDARKIPDMSLIKHPRSPYYWVDIQPSQGARIRRSTGTTDRKQAQKFHDELKAALWKPVNQTTWDKAVKKWLLNAPRSASDAYIVRAIGDIPTICPEAFEAVIQHKTAGTYNKYRSLILAICNLSKIEIEIPKRKVATTRDKFLTDEEWKRLYGELPYHLKNIAAFALYTGLRQSNVTQLTWDRVDMDRGLFWINAQDMKGKKAHGLPLSSNAIALLSQFPKSERTGYVFLYKGKPIAKVKLAWQKACIRAGVGTRDERGKYGGFTFHGLRHTWASWKVQAGTPLMIVKELGSWSSLQMVERYAHLNPEHLRQYVD